MSLNFIRDGVCVDVSWTVSCFEEGMILNRKGSPNLNKKSHAWSAFSWPTLASDHVISLEKVLLNPPSKADYFVLGFRGVLTVSVSGHMPHSIAVHLFIFPTSLWAQLGQGPRLPWCVPGACTGLTLLGILSTCLLNLRVSEQHCVPLIDWTGTKTSEIHYSCSGTIYEVKG